jgi:hypothetical protein
MQTMLTMQASQAGRSGRSLLMRLIWLWIIGMLGIATLYLLFTDVLTPTHQENMAQTRIYAYRDWQSTGIRLEVDEQVVIRAKGEWLYTPNEWHGAGGHARYPAPDFYPMSGVPGGVLLARIGEANRPVWVGERTTLWVNEPGMLYLRINDDMLSDNKGVLDMEIEVIPAPEPG